MRLIAVAALLASPALACGPSPDLEALDWYRRFLKADRLTENLEADSVAPIPLPTLLQNATCVAELFDATTKPKEGWGALHHTVLWTETGCELWKAEPVQVRKILQAAGVAPTDEDSVRKAAEAVLALPGMVRFEAKRLEVKGLKAVYREHKLSGAFSCGFMGAYVEDVVLTFDEMGVLADVKKTGIPDLKFDEYFKLAEGDDPFLQDEVHGGKQMIDWNRERLAREASLVADLDHEDPARRDAAECALCDGGIAGREALQKARESSSPEKRGRIDRILRWTAPDWEADAEEQAQSWYDAQLGSETEPWTRQQFAKLDLSGRDLGSVPAKFRFFRGFAVGKAGVNARYDLVLLAKDGTCCFWNGRVEQVAGVLWRTGYRSTEPGALRTAALVAKALPRKAYDPAEELPVEADRAETSGREVRYHEHLMTLLSGRIGTYAEDDVFVFAEDGRLSEVRTTGIHDLTVQDRNRILAEADPWLRLAGFVREDTRAALKRAQEGKKRELPKHEEEGR
jgi:hypothetical protein